MRPGARCRATADPATGLLRLASSATSGGGGVPAGHVMPGPVIKSPPSLAAIFNTVGSV